MKVGGYCCSDAPVRVGGCPAAGIIVAVALFAASHATRAKPAEVATEFPDGEFALEEIVVPARKREERPGGIPISATTRTTEALRNAGEVELVDLSTSVLNLSYSDVLEGGSFVIRGISKRAVSAGLDDGLRSMSTEFSSGAWRHTAYNQELTRIDRAVSAHATAKCGLYYGSSRQAFLRSHRGARPKHEGYTGRGYVGMPDTAEGDQFETEHNWRCSSA